MSQSPRPGRQDESLRTGNRPSPTGSLRSAVFLDRDGTLIEDRGCVSDPAQVAFYPDTVEALRRLQERFLLFIVTNQPWVARGILTREDVDRVNAWVVSHLARQGVTITAVYVCPHERSDGCSCIKPNPYFLHQAAAEYGVDLGRSFTVGDHPHDVDFARSAGARGVYVRTGHGSSHVGDLAPGEIVVSGIAEAADWILRAS
jgi:D-glycero-D-manno-heptose 1,7-bisphosphate phosphatase